eukprot:8504532-Alexandrium_andersonii.AAC.1
MGQARKRRASPKQEGARESDRSARGAGNSGETKLPGAAEDPSVARSRRPHQAGQRSATVHTSLQVPAH